MLLGALLLIAAQAFAADAEPGAWRIGMSREEAMALAEHGPYQDVAAGKVEASGGRFRGRKAKTLLTFGDAGLRSVEVHAYEGKEWRKAKDAALEIFDRFAADNGGASIKDIADKVSRKDLDGILDRTLGTAEPLNKTYTARGRAMLATYDMVPLEQPAGSRLHAHLIYRGTDDSYAVVLYQDAPGVPPRDAEESITIETIDKK